jgi:HPt (histidine-containing phosphotransfer) domain-containing protein
VLWPEIDGIDSAEARERWCDDVRLFSVMLGRFLEECVDVMIPAEIQVSDARDVYIQRMHRLRGGACMLGAKAIFELASEVEATCVSVEIERAKTVANRLAIELQRLRLSADRVFVAAPTEAEDTASSASVELEPHLIVELDALLRQHNLTALDRFSVIAPRLRQYMGSVSYGVLRRHIDNLEFDDAANVLPKPLDKCGDSIPGITGDY